jgi:hypothetical protein
MQGIKGFCDNLRAQSRDGQKDVFHDVFSVEKTPQLKIMIRGLWKQLVLADLIT